MLTAVQKIGKNTCGLLELLTSIFIFILVVCDFIPLLLTLGCCPFLGGGSIIVDSLLIDAPIVEFCVCSMFCCALLCGLSSFAIILMGKRAGCFTLFESVVFCDTCSYKSVDLPHGAVGWSVVCNCGIICS